MPSSQFIPETRGLERTRWLLSLVCAASVAGCAQGVGTLPVGTAAARTRRRGSGTPSMRAPRLSTRSRGLRTVRRRTPA